LFTTIGLPLSLFLYSPPTLLLQPTQNETVNNKKIHFRLKKIQEWSGLSSKTDVSLNKINKIYTDIKCAKENSEFIKVL